MKKKNILKKSKDALRRTFLRWQVEQLFKSWKSYYGIHKIRNIKQERFECHLYGQLIALLISSMITFEARSALYENEEIEVSEMKCTKELRESAEEFFRASGSPIKINNLFHQYTEVIRRRCRKCKKKNCETPFLVLKNTMKEEEKLILLHV
ncbi:transposase [Alteribacter aurantiacus]|uniref:transposase n=1 Tax=Alteribacter aurantiacus TaxID=254410 RepID=UPI000415FD69